MLRIARRTTSLGWLGCLLKLLLGASWDCAAFPLRGTLRDGAEEDEDTERQAGEKTPPLTLTTDICKNTHCEMKWRADTSTECVLKEGPRFVWLWEFHLPWEKVGRGGELTVEIILYMPCGEPLLRTQDPRGIRGRGPWLSKL